VLRAVPAHPELLTPLLSIIHRVIAGFLLKQARRTAAPRHGNTASPGT
jgi:hypothetical protein